MADPKRVRPAPDEPEDVAELPDREETSLVNANLAVPINAAIAANVLSDDSIAAAEATQTAPIDQSTGSDLPGLPEEQ